MSKEKVIVPDEVHAALERVRGDDAATFTVLGYSDVVTLKVLGTGTGGLDQAKQLMPADKESYALIRYSHKIGMARTTKYAFVAYVPEYLNPMRKSLMTAHRPQVRNLLKPQHAQLEVTDQADLDENEILEKIGFTSGTVSHVTSEASASDFRAKQEEQKRVKVGKRWVADTGASSTPAASKSPENALNVSLEVHDEIANVRNNGHPRTWIITGYEGDQGSSVVLLKSGTGDVNEMAAGLDSGRVQYALFRFVEEIDTQSSNVKFCFVRLIPQSVPARRRGIIGTQSSAVDKAFGYHHVDFAIDEPSQISREIVLEKLNSLSGKRDAISSKQETWFASERKHNAWKAPKTFIPAAAKKVTEGQKLAFEDEATFNAALAAVHSDGNPSNWCLGSFENGKMQLLATGNGEDVGDMLPHLNGAINFGLLRVVETIEVTKATKFVFLIFQPKSISPIKRAKAAPVRSAVATLFQPWTLDIFVDEASELTQADIMDKITSGSGTKNRVTTRSR